MLVCDKSARYPHVVEVLMTPGQQPVTQQLSVGGKDPKPGEEEGKQKEEGQQRITRKKENPD
jgi:hypothetical protein